MSCKNFSIDKYSNVIVKLWVKPGSKSSYIKSVSDDGIEVHINAQPTKGQANAELLKFMASVLGTKKTDISLDSGATSRHKLLKVSGLTSEQVEQRISSQILDN